MMLIHFSLIALSSPLYLERKRITEQEDGNRNQVGGNADRAWRKGEREREINRADQRPFLFKSLQFTVQRNCKTIEIKWIDKRS